MAMATVSLHLLLLLLLLVAPCTAVVARNEESATSHRSTTTLPPSRAAARFLRSSCAAVDLPKACFKTLLPYADSFHGSIVRVARASAAIAAARQHAFADELSHLKLRAPGTGSKADMTLFDCVQRAEASDMDANNTLAYFNNLVAGVSSKSEFEWEHSQVLNWLSVALSGMMECIDWIHDAGEDAAALPALKKVTAGCMAVSPYMHIALDLTYAILPSNV